MRSSLVAVGLLLLAGCAASGQQQRVPCPDPDTAEGMVCAFYEHQLELRPAGLPTVEQQASFAPLLSDRLQERLDAARRVQAAFRAEHPAEKPPLVDGCLFASLFEGPQQFSVGRRLPSDVGVPGTIEVVRVPVRFGYEDVEWQDVVIVVRERGRYVVDDIEYGGAGPFNPAGRLSERLDDPQ